MKLTPLIKALLSPEAFPERPVDVRLIQTHISYIFLLPNVVYKIKKPVDFGFLDFTTLEKRRFFCEEEVRLNRRLAPDIYQGVVPISLVDGRATVNGTGAAVEYAVKMKRVPDNTLLINHIKKGVVTTDAIRKIAQTIASFHGQARTSDEIAAFGGAETIGFNVTENFKQTIGFVGSIIRPVVYERIKNYTLEFLETNAVHFAKRVAQGSIRDCHGDILCEHVSINAKVDIIDCIEFNERFRFSDIVADAAFLSMDIDFLGRHDLAVIFDAAYFAASGDVDGAELLNFYKCYRAYVRGKVASMKSLEPEVSEDEADSAYVEAIRHFHLASLYADGGYGPTLVIVTGLSGTGKTTLADAVSRAADMPVLSSDLIRKRIAGVRADEHKETAYGAGIYTEAFTENTYAALIDEASRLLKAGRPVIVEATFSKRRHLLAALNAAKEAGAQTRIMECRASDDTVARNMAERKAVGTVSDAGFEVYLKQKEGFEHASVEHLSVDADKPLKHNLRSVLTYIYS